MSQLVRYHPRIGHTYTPRLKKRMPGAGGYLLTKGGSHEKARAIFNACVAAGYTHAMTWMSYMEDNGFGGPENPDAAAEYDRMAAEAGELELNMAEPIMAYCLLHGLMILRNAAITLTSRCIVGIEANVERCLEYVQNSIGLVTALNPVLGYEKSAAIAKEALKTGGSVYDLVLEKGWLTKDELDDMLKPENMTQPRKLK